MRIRSLIFVVGSLVVALHAAESLAQTVSCTGVPGYNATVVYNPGNRVVHNGKLYEAQVPIWNTPPDYCPSCGWWSLLGTCGTGGGDTTPPSVPTGSNSPAKTSTSVSLAWNASTDNPGGSGVAGYDVYRGGALAGSPTATSFTVTGLSPATTYSFTVRARDNAGNAVGAERAAVGDHERAGRLQHAAQRAHRASTHRPEDRTTVSLAWNASTSGHELHGAVPRLPERERRSSRWRARATPWAGWPEHDLQLHRAGHQRVRQLGPERGDLGDHEPAPPPERHEDPRVLRAVGRLRAQLPRQEHRDQRLGQQAHPHQLRLRQRHQRAVRDRRRLRGLRPVLRRGLQRRRRGRHLGRGRAARQLQPAPQAQGSCTRTSRILWSFGGWTWSGGFGQAAANPTAFANSCYNLVHDPRWNGVFDGIDIDWEYPNACGLSCDTSGPQAYVNLMAALRSRFGSAAGDRRRARRVRAHQRGELRRRGPVRRLVQRDDLRLLRRLGRPPVPPRRTRRSPPTRASRSANFFADYAIQLYKSKGVPASKLLLGVGFYGRGWAGVANANGGLNQPACGPAPGHVRAGQRGLQGAGEHAAPPRAPWPAPPWPTAAASGGATTRPSTLAGKMGYKKSQGLGGAFFWELSGDTSGGASDQGPVRQPLKDDRSGPWASKPTAPSGVRGALARSGGNWPSATSRSRRAWRSASSAMAAMSSALRAVCCAWTTSMLVVAPAR